MAAPAPERVPDPQDEIERSNHLDDLRIARSVWNEEFTAAEYVAMMSTALDHRLMESEKRSYRFAENAASDRQASRGPHLQAQPDDPQPRSPKTLAAQ